MIIVAPPRTQSNSIVFICPSVLEAGALMFHASKRQIDFKGARPPEVQTPPLTPTLKSHVNTIDSRARNVNTKFLLGHGGSLQGPRPM